MAKKYTPEARPKILAEIEKLQATGMSRKIAAKTAGISVATFHDWKRQLENTPNVIIHREGDTPTKKYKRKESVSLQEPVVMLVRLGDLKRVWGNL